MKIQHIQHLFETLPEEEWIILDVLRSIITKKLPNYCKEKLSYNVPFFYGNKGICIIWPASIPRGGVKSDVLLGFWQGNKLIDPNNYLKKGSNKKVFYKIYQNADQINVEAIQKLLDESIAIDLNK